MKWTRVSEWGLFADKVKSHIEKYTVGQYKDLNLENPDEGDNAQHFSEEQIKSQLERYVKRIGSNARGTVEAKRDLLKMAHYACILWGKYERGEIKSADEYTAVNIDELNIVIQKLQCLDSDNINVKVIMEK